MALTKSPAFQLYPDKALAGTDHLSGDGFKGYWKILWWMWLHGPGHCRMPNTEGAWKRATGMNGSQLQTVRQEIMDEEHPLLRKRTLKGREFLLSLGLQKEAKKQREWSKKSSKGGKASVKARRQKGLLPPEEERVVEPPYEPKGEPKGNTPSPSPSPSLSEKKRKNKKSLRYEDHPDFVHWYSIYPRHKGKYEALKAWLKLHPDKEFQEKIIEATRQQKKEHKELKFWKHPATWLNQRGWEDELDGDLRTKTPDERVKELDELF
jgi:hypothetical protein